MYELANVLGSLLHLRRARTHLFCHRCSCHPHQLALCIRLVLLAYACARATGRTLRTAALGGAYTCLRTLEMSRLAARLSLSRLLCDTWSPSLCRMRVASGRSGAVSVPSLRLAVLPTVIVHLQYFALIRPLPVDVGLLSWVMTRADV